MCYIIDIAYKCRLLCYIMNKTKNHYVEIPVPKGTGKQLRALAAVWKLSISQTQERIIRSGIEAYWTEQPEPGQVKAGERV